MAAYSLLCYNLPLAACNLQVDSREAFVLPRKLLNDAARCFVQAPAPRPSPHISPPASAAAAGAGSPPVLPRAPSPLKRVVSAKAPRLPDGSLPHLTAVPGGLPFSALHVRVYYCDAYHSHAFDAHSTGSLSCTLQGCPLPPQLHRHPLDWRYWTP